MKALKHRRRTVLAMGAAAAASLAVTSLAAAQATPTVEFDLRVHGTGGKTAEVTHAGQSVLLDVYAFVRGLDSNPDNDAIGSGSGTFTSSTGGLLGDLLGLGPPTPYNATASYTGDAVDFDGDGDIDIWSAGATSTGKYSFRQPPPYPLPQPAGGSLVGQFQFTVNNFSLDQTVLTWTVVEAPVGTNVLVTADGGPHNDSELNIINSAPVTIRGVNAPPPPPGAVLMSGSIIPHTSITQETWVTPGQSLTFETGVDVTAGSALNAGARPLQINVNDATSGNFGGAIVGGSIAVATSANGTFTQASGSTQVGNVTVGAAATRTGTLNVSGGSIQGVDLNLAAAGTGVYTQSGGTADFVNFNVARNSTATVSGGALTVVGLSKIGGGGSNGTFTQAGGTTHLQGTVYVGSGFGGAGQLVVQDGTLNAGQTYIGANSGSGSLQVSGAGIFKTTSLLLNQNNLGSASVNITGGQVHANGIQFLGSAIVTQSGGTVSSTPNSNLQVGLSAGDKQYVLSGGVLEMAGVRILKTNTAPMSGTGKVGGFVQTGGAFNPKSFTIESPGTAHILGGTMNIGAKLDLRGTLDYGGTSTQLNVNTNAFASFVLGQLIGVDNATFNGATGSLMSFKDQAQFDSVGTVTSAGIIHIAGQELVIEENQSIGGSGTIEGDVTNEGSIAPGSSPGAIAVNGDYTQASTGALLMEIAGNAGETFDTISITGAATLDGVLDVSLLDAYVPSASDSFTILIAASVSGTFDNVTGGAISFGGGSFDVAYSPTSVTLSNFTPVPEPGSVTLLMLGMAAMARRRRPQRVS